MGRLEDLFLILVHFEVASDCKMVVHDGCIPPGRHHSTPRGQQLFIPILNGISLELFAIEITGEAGE